MISGNLARKFIIGGYDISRHVISVDGLNTSQEKPEWGDMPIVPELNLILANDKNQFSTFSNNSMFRGVKLQDTIIEIFYNVGNSSILEWKGFISNAPIDHKSKRVHVNGYSHLGKKIDSPGLVPTGSGTPAKLSKDLFTLFSIPVDESSYSRAISFQTNLVNCVVEPNLLESSITLYEIQKQLANAGPGRIYSNNNNEMIYEVFESITPTITFELTDKHMESHPDEMQEERQSSAYKVIHVFGSANSVGFVTGAPQQTLDFGASGTVKLLDETSAIHVADQWELISNLQKRRITFGVSHSIGYMLDLNSYIKLTWAGGGFENESLEIVAINRTDSRYTMITGRTV